MPWKQRGACRYYVKNERSGRRVVSTYIGSGPAANLVAERDALDQAERARAREALQAARAAVRAADLPVFAVLQIVNDVVARVLLARGFHKHRRQWRKRRMEIAQHTAPPTRAEIERLIDAAMDDDAGRPELAALREAMASHPDAGRHYDLAEIAATALIRAMPSDKAHKAITQGRIIALRRELGGAHPSPLERLLIDQVVLTYIYLNQVEYQLSKLWEKSVEPATVVFWEERVARCQLRYLRAVESLARVRRLLKLPSIQVNVALDGGQQVNMAGGAR